MVDYGRPGESGRGVRVGGRLPKRVESRIGCAKFNETGQGLRQENPQHESPPVTRGERDSDQREARETKNYEPGGMGWIMDKDKASLCLGLLLLSFQLLRYGVLVMGDGC